VLRQWLEHFHGIEPFCNSRAWFDGLGRPKHIAAPKCWVPCDHVPIRSWALFKARDMLRELIRTLKAEQSVVKVA